jgi:hypothetical protein
MQCLIYIHDSLALVATRQQIYRSNCIMSRESKNDTYEQTSCMRENLLSVWIWMREMVDVEIRNRTTAMIAENNLVSVRDNIEKNKDKIAAEVDITMEDLRTKARLCKGGTKEQSMLRLKKLLPLLQKVKGLRHKMGLATQQLNLLDAQINAFENGRNQKEMTETLRAGVAAMRKVGITDDASDMDTIVLDMEETMEEQNRLTDSMTVSTINSMDENNSDENLMKELMALAGNFEEVEESIPAGTVTPVVEPIKPTDPVLPTVVLPTASVSVTVPMIPESMPDSEISKTKISKTDNTNPHQGDSDDTLYDVELPA